MYFKKNVRIKSSVLVMCFKNQDLSCYRNTDLNKCYDWNKNLILLVLAIKIKQKLTILNNTELLLFYYNIILLCSVQLLMSFKNQTSINKITDNR